MYNKIQDRKSRAQAVSSSYSKSIPNASVLVVMICLLFGLFSCEDVVEVDVDSIEPRLVVEADIEWERGTIGNEQSIRLSQSTDYFNQTYIPVTNAQVSVTKLNSSQSFPFTHTANGIYTTSSFLPELDAEYQLNITSGGEQYQAKERLMPVTPVSRIEQNMVTDIVGDEVVSVDFYTNDPVGVENFYYVKYDLRNTGNDYLTVWDDDFRDGNEIRFLYRAAFLPVEDTLATGDNIKIQYMGASEGFANYMEILTEQAYAGGDPFSSTPVQLKGNVQNLTTTDRNAFGYFRLSQKDTFSVVVE